MPAALAPWATAHQEDHIQALQVSPQSFFAEDVVNPELLGLATGQLLLQPADPQEAAARRKEATEVRVGILVGDC